MYSSSNVKTGGLLSRRSNEPKPRRDLGNGPCLGLSVNLGRVTLPPVSVFVWHPCFDFLFHGFTHRKPLTRVPLCPTTHARQTFVRHEPKGFPLSVIYWALGLGNQGGTNAQGCNRWQHAGSMATLAQILSLKGGSFKQTEVYYPLRQPLGPQSIVSF